MHARPADALNRALLSKSRFGLRPRIEEIVESAEHALASDI